MALNKTVDFFTAKSLKEKGFDVKNRTHYQMYGTQNIPQLEPYNDTKWNIYKDYYLAPTFAEVIMWLYKKHNIWIEISLTDYSRDYYFEYTITTSNNRDFNDEECFDSAKRIYDKNKHNTPIRAYKAAINYCLLELINL